MFRRSRESIEFLADWQIQEALMRVITQAKRRLVLVSPYNQHWGHLKREIAAAQERGVMVTFYYRTDESSPMAEYDGVTSVGVRMLHAKIYVNESVALITTMNLVETSASHSREVGLLIKDSQLRREVDEYIRSLADADSIPDRAGWPGASTAANNHVNRNAHRQRRPQSPATVRTANDIVRHIANSGYCIECGNPINFTIERPLCSQCYSRYGRNGTHKICHQCGEPHQSKLSEPLCPVCHRESPKVGV